MSGAFGWVRNDSPAGGNDTVQPNSNYKGAQKRHQGGAYAPSAAPVDYNSGPKRKLRNYARKVPTAKGAVPDGKDRVVCTAANVLAVVIDGTGSMGEWPAEIFRRLPLLYTSASEYLGTEDLEILFIAHGDMRSDSHPIQVGKIGRGPELDQVLASFNMNAFHGGGQGTESHELVMYYLLDRVDMSAAQNVFTFFLTDEAACDSLDERAVKEHLGGGLKKGSVDTHLVLEVLRRKCNVFTVLCETHSYNPEPIKRWWEKRLGREHVLPLSDARRVVDVMLGTLASLVGKKDRFEDDLKTRLLPTRHGSENVGTVMTAIDMVGKGSPSDPFHDVDDTGGTKALL